MKMLFVPLLMIAATQVSAGSAIENVMCDESTALFKKLKRDHGAERLGRGVRGPDVLLEVWAVPSTGDWTIIQTYTTGKSCVVAIGDDWETLSFPIADPA